MADLTTKKIGKLPELTMVSRAEWGAVKPKEVKPFADLPDHVRFTDTMSPFCTDREECKEWVWRLQNIHMGRLGMPDIMYNFLMCGDGSVFEGRGWNAESFKPKEFERLQSRCIDIAYLIDLKAHELTPEMKTASRHILTHGQVLNHIKPKCRLINNLFMKCERKKGLFRNIKVAS